MAKKKSIIQPVNKTNWTFVIMGIIFIALVATVWVIKNRQPVVVEPRASSSCTKCTFTGQRCLRLANHESGVIECRNGCMQYKVKCCCGDDPATCKTSGLTAFCVQNCKDDTYQCSSNDTQQIIQRCTYDKWTTVAPCPSGMRCLKASDPFVQPICR